MTLEKWVGIWLAGGKIRKTKKHETEHKAKDAAWRAKCAWNKKNGLGIPNENYITAKKL